MTGARGVKRDLHGSGVRDFPAAWCVSGADDSIVNWPVAGHALPHDPPSAPHNIAVESGAYSRYRIAKEHQPMKSTRLATLLVFALALGCGKTRTAKPKPAEPPVEPAAESSAATVDARLVPDPVVPPCQRPKPAPSALLDDFEDGDGTLSLTSGRNGSWFIATDGTNGAKSRPGVGPANPERLVPARCDSLFGLHFSGQGFVTWGAVAGAVLHFEKRSQPVDLSQYRGIAFWIKRGFQHAGVLRLNLDDAATHPDGGQCSEPVVSGRTACWNSYGLDMPLLSEDWEERRVLFSELTQKIPEPSPRPLDTAHVHRISIKASPGNTFDVWLDDISLF
jgi:hypothetical protein